MLSATCKSLSVSNISAREEKIAIAVVQLMIDTIQYQCYMHVTQLVGVGVSKFQDNILLASYHVY